MKLILLSLMLLATPVWAEDKPCKDQCYWSHDRLSCIQICEIKTILKTLVEKKT